MGNKAINLEIIKLVAEGLKDLRKRMVFVGGAIVSIYADDPAADEARPTYDIDLTISLAGYGEWVELQENLAILGFEPEMEEKIICRFGFKGLTIDIMPADNIGIGPANVWYKPGLSNLIQYKISEGLKINILPVGYYLATKFAAFNDRGPDPRTSRDFEDIIYVTDNNLTLIERLRNVDTPLLKYLKTEYGKILNNPYKEEIISVHLSSYSPGARLPLILDKIKNIIYL